MEQTHKNIYLTVVSHVCRLKTNLTWDVGQHDDDEAVVVVERHVIQVRESNGEHPSSAYEWQSRVNGHQLSDNSQRVKDDEKVVSAGKIT